MKCIICKNEKTIEELSDEHVFPDLIGGTLVIRTVCKSCSSKLADNVDIHLVNHWLIQCERQTLKIPGKSGKIPNPLERGILNDALNLNIIYKFDNKGEPEDLYIVPKIEKVKNEDGNEEVTIIVDKKDKNKLPGIVNKMFKRKGLSELTKEEIEEHSKEKLNPSPWMKLNAEIDTKQYKRAILKIAYELACYWLGDSYFDDKVGEMIRKCILDNDLKDEWYLEYPIK